MTRVLLTAWQKCPAHQGGGHRPDSWPSSHAPVPQPRHSEGVGPGPGAISEGDAAGARAAVSPARHQPHLGVLIPSLWQRGQCAS